MSDESAAQAAQLQSNLIQDGEDSVEAANGEGGGAGTEGTVRSQHFLLTVIDNLSEYFGVEHTQNDQLSSSLSTFFYIEVGG
ncbi:unnamed protein product [Anisakis simplex]|uniref:Ubiquitinyl hydrolase 1 n=1 Tax=Anisakis simplex TaxID=6269 RepID=A0A0M3JJ13_ANISI|nr:unnamed protein product [Anisakis simplex]